MRLALRLFERALDGAWTRGATGRTLFYVLASTGKTLETQAIMNLRLFILTGLLAGRVCAQEAPPEPQPKPAKLAFRVLQESVIRQRNGDTVTFKRVEPPVLPVKQPAMTAAEAARVQRCGSVRSPRF